MNFVIKNNSSRDLSQLTPLIQEFYPYAKKHMGFDRDASIVFESDLENAKNPLGKTAFYDPSNDTVTIFVDNRHPKDIMRSISHELVHHHQNCDGRLDNIGPTHEGYAQSDTYLREMEEDAYRRGNLIFRDWENQKNIKEIRKMKVTKEELRNYVYEAMKEVLNEKVRKDSPDRRQGDEPADRVKPLEEDGDIEEGAKPDFLDLDKDGDKEEPMKDAADNVEESLNENDGIAMSIDGVFAPSHYCVHHGGVEHNGSTQMAEAVSHNYNEELDRVTHYDMKLKDGTILENVAFEDIQVTNASLAEGHNHPMKRDDDEEEEEKKKDLDALGADIAGAQSGVNEETEEVNEDSETKEVNEDSEEINEESEETEEINEESEEEETLNEWKNNTLYKKLLKEYTKR